MSDDSTDLEARIESLLGEMGEESEPAQDAPAGAAPAGGANTNELDSVIEALLNESRSVLSTASSSAASEPVAQDVAEDDAGAREIRGHVSTSPARKRAAAPAESIGTLDDQLAHLTDKMITEEFGAPELAADAEPEPEAVVPARSVAADDVEEAPDEVEAEASTIDGGWDRVEVEGAHEPAADPAADTADEPASEEAEPEAAADEPAADGPAEPEVIARDDAEPDDEPSADVKPTAQAVDEGEPAPAASPASPAPAVASTGASAKKSAGKRERARSAALVAWGLLLRAGRLAEPHALRVAHLVSSPLRGRSPMVRDVIGWVAVVTGFWAVCVAAYVFLIRSPAPPPRVEDDAPGIVGEPAPPAEGGR